MDDPPCSGKGASTFLHLAAACPGVFRTADATARLAVGVAALAEEAGLVSSCSA